MRRSAALGVFYCLTAIAGFAAESISMPSIWRYAHPQAKAAIGIEWSRVLHSPVGQQLRAKLQKSEFGKFKGLDIIEDIQRVFITSPGKANGVAEENTPAVVAVQGNFDLDKLRRMAALKSVKPTSYQSVELLEGKEGDGPSVVAALVSPQTILLGDGDSVRAALDHYLKADPSQASDALFLRASELGAKHDIWLVTKASPSDFAQKTMEQVAFLKDVETVEAGISLQQGLGLELNLGTKSDESAQTLAGGIQFMLGMMTANQPKDDKTQDLTEKLYISTEGPLVHIAFSLDQQEIETALQKIDPSMLPRFSVDGEEGIFRNAANGGHPAPEPPPPPRKQMIKIYGLEDGVREIPLSQ